MIKSKHQTTDRQLLNRRRFLQIGLAAGVSVAGLPFSYARKSRTVVIVGGGIAGAKTARGIKSASPDTRVIVIEKRKQFVSGPAVLGYVFGQRNYTSTTRSYDALKKMGIEFVHDQCQNIDLDKQRVITAQHGHIAYDYLVITTGIHLAYEEIEGLDLADKNVGSLIDRDRSQQLRQQLDTFKGGTIVVNVPNSALVCPPAPYEYAMLLNEMIKRKKLDANIILVDAGISPQPPPLSKKIAAELMARSPMIEYVPVGGNVNAIDHQERVLYTTEGDEYEYDLATLVPVNTVAPFIGELELGDGADVFVKVDPLTMRSSKHANVFAMGDVARSPLGKSGYAADVSATLCIETLTRELNGKPPSTTSKDIVVACYPYTGSDDAMLMEVSYHIERSQSGIKIKTRKKTTGPQRDNVTIRNNWERQLHQSTFG